MFLATNTAGNCCTSLIDFYCSLTYKFSFIGQKSNKSIIFSSVENFSSIFYTLHKVILQSINSSDCLCIIYILYLLIYINDYISLSAECQVKPFIPQLSQGDFLAFKLKKWFTVLILFDF